MVLSTTKKNNLKMETLIFETFKKMNKARYRYLYLLLLIPVIHQILFSYMPIYGLIIAFKNFNYHDGILGSQWNNFSHFKILFSDQFFARAFWNTLRLSILGLLFSFPGAVIFALLLNELLHGAFKKVVQTISYLPHFMSWVVVAGFAYQLLSPDIGFINVLLLQLGIINKSIYFMGEPSAFIYIYIISGLWEGIGWGSIIYLSTISSIDPVQYEAAEIDGANRFQQVIHVTIPGMMPTIIIMLILSFGNILSVSFDQIFNLYNPLVYSVSDVISTYVYRQGLINCKYDYAAAIGLFQNVIGFIIVMMANFIARKYNKEYSLF